MELTVLLITIVILGKVVNSEDQKQLVFIAGPLLGINFFFINPYCLYYLQLLPASKLKIQITLSVLIILTLALAWAILQLKHYKLTQVTLIGFFLISWVLSDSYDIDIKDKLAEKSGFFKSQTSLPYDALSFSGKTINSPRDAYTLLVPENWEAQKDNVTGLPYYLSQSSESSITEFRPGCYNRQRVNITDIVRGMSARYENSETSEHQCYLWRNIGYACKITLGDTNGLVDRVRWIAANKQTRYMFDLDFITQSKNKRDLTVIDQIFNSVVFTTTELPVHDCVQSVKWL